MLWSVLLANGFNSGAERECLHCILNSGCSAKDIMQDGGPENLKLKS